MIDFERIEACTHPAPHFNQCKVKMHLVVQKSLQDKNIFVFNENTSMTSKKKYMTDKNKYVFNVHD